jgi:hypothetical protein
MGGLPSSFLGQVQFWIQGLVFCCLPSSHQGFRRSTGDGVLLPEILLRIETGFEVFRWTKFWFDGFVFEILSWLILGHTQLLPRADYFRGQRPPSRYLSYSWGSFRFFFFIILFLRAQFQLPVYVVSICTVSKAVTCKWEACRPAVNLFVLTISKVSKVHESAVCTNTLDWVKL